MLDRLGIVTPAVLRRSASATPATRAVIGMIFFRATRSDAKSGVRKGKALPARRFESVRRHSQERLRTCPSLCGLDRIETVIQDETGEKGAIETAGGTGLALLGASTALAGAARSSKSPANCAGQARLSRSKQVVDNFSECSHLSRLSGGPHPARGLTLGCSLLEL
jgi:hypothetical protein